MLFVRGSERGSEREIKRKQIIFETTEYIDDIQGTYRIVMTEWERTGFELFSTTRSCKRVSTRLHTARPATCNNKQYGLKPHGAPSIRDHFLRLSSPWLLNIH